MVKNFIIVQLIKILLRLRVSIIMNVEIENLCSSPTKVVMKGKNINLYNLSITNCDFLTEKGTSVSLEPNRQFKIIEED